MFGENLPRVQYVNGKTRSVGVNEPCTNLTKPDSVVGVRTLLSSQCVVIPSATRRRPSYVGRDSKIDGLG
mgnify:CR=1 FL=1